MKLSEKFAYKGDGYNPFIIREHWQVAQLNYSLEEELDAISCLDVHRKTDEVFVLIEGIAVLITAEIVEDKIDYNLQLMKPDVTYNIPCNVWHKIAMQSGSKVLIVENANTHVPLPEGDYEFYYLSDKQKIYLSDLIDHFLSNNVNAI